jgi:predicted nucleotidyltransferase
MLDFSGSTSSDLVRAGRVLGSLSDAAGPLGISYVVVGATARDILSAARPGRTVHRMTSDVDIAVAVDSWAEFNRLADRLPGRGRVAHKFVIEGIPVDVVPCGPIESAARTITWPDDFVMNTLGLYEAMEGAFDVLLPGPVRTRVISLPGLVGLKLLSWYDRRQDTRRDAVDLATLMGPAAAEAMRFILMDDRLRSTLAGDMNHRRLDPEGVLFGLREGLSDPGRAGAVDGWP